MHIEIERPPVDTRFDLWPENRVHIVPDLGGDSENYEVLENAVARAAGVNGLSIQIGLRLGYGAKLILDTQRETNQVRTHIAIDPYGNIEYDATSTDRGRRDYTNHMMHDALSNLHLYALLQGMNFLHFPLEDTEFFYRFADGVPVYDATKELVNEYAFVVLDGPHSTKPVLDEFKWFDARTKAGAVMVFDDVRTYEHSVVHAVAETSGWQVLETSPCKISYRKEG